MKLIKLLIQNSKIIIAKAMVAGAVSGLVSSVLVVLVHLQLENIDDLSLTLPAIFGFACILRIATSFYSQLILIKIGQKAIYELRLKLSRSILTSPLINLEKIGNSALTAALIDDISAISQTLIIIPLIGVNIALIGGCLFYLGYLSATAFFICVSFVVAWFVSVQLLTKSAQKHLQSARDATDRLYESIHGLTAGIKELKLSSERRKVFWTNQLNISTEDLKNHTIKSEIAYTLAANWSRLIIFMLIGVVLFVLTRIVRADVTVLSGVMLTVLFIMSQLDVILNQLPQLGRAETALNKIADLQFSLHNAGNDTTFLNEENSNFQGFKYKFQSLELRGLTHLYFRGDEEKSFALENINFQIEMGELIFVVGGNGSGKTTLAKLILGLYAPENGEIVWNGEIVTDENREQYRENFGAVFSDFHLFKDLPCEISAEKAAILLERLHLSHKVKIIENRFSTLQLSQGQRKRLALLAVYAQDKPVYLFDEWAANQDPLFKEIYYLEMLPALKSAGKTVIAITHDDKYFHLADRLVKIENGRIIADTSQIYKKKSAVQTVK